MGGAWPTALVFCSLVKFRVGQVLPGAGLVIEIKQIGIGQFAGSGKRKVVDLSRGHLQAFAVLAHAQLEHTAGVEEKRAAVVGKVHGDAGGQKVGDAAVFAQQQFHFAAHDAPPLVRQSVGRNANGRARSGTLVVQACPRVEGDDGAGYRVEAHGALGLVRRPVAVRREAGLVGQALHLRFHIGYGYIGLALGHLPQGRWGVGGQRLRALGIMPPNGYEHAKHEQHRHDVQGIVPEAEPYVLRLLACRNFFPKITIGRLLDLLQFFAQQVL